MQVSYSFHNIDLQFSGRILLKSADITIDRRIGLVGRNGTGKTSLLHYLLKRIPYQDFGYLPQELSSRELQMVLIEFLGFHKIWQAWECSNAGQASTEDLILLEGHWELPNQLVSELEKIGLDRQCLRRPLAHFSGGQRTSLALLKIQFATPNILLLDEPSNNLDEAHRVNLQRWLSAWNKPALIVSHDRDLLNLMHGICELSDQKILRHPGNFTTFWQIRNKALELAEKSRHDAREEIRRLKRQAQERAAKAQRRARVGKEKRSSGSQPKMFADFKKNRAESSFSRTKTFESERLAKAANSLAKATSNRCKEADLHFKLHPVEPVKGGAVVTIRELEWSHGPQIVFSNLNWQLITGERVALEGPHGCGKSSLLQILCGKRRQTKGIVKVSSGKIAIIEQFFLYRHPHLTLWENLVHGQELAHMSDSDWRNELARFLLNADLLSRPVLALSGGERVRAQLALAFAGQIPDLILIDEVTNHLDLDTIIMLESLFRAFKGTLVVVSHDEVFKQNLGLERIPFKSLLAPSGHALFRESRQVFQPL
jgi:ATPase subunit of ABC transporter with duplicated ATPase domains